MSSLENLITKIIKDSHDKGSSIIRDAELEASQLVEERVDEAERIRASIIEDGKRESEVQKELIVSAKRIEVRDKMLKTKQDMIAKVFDMAVERLNALNQDEYLGFLQKYLSELELDGDEEICVPEAYAGISLASVNEKLGEKGKLRLGDRFAKSGFIVAKNGVENNNTYEALIDYYRDELEKTVAENLF